MTHPTAQVYWMLSAIVSSTMEKSVREILEEEDDAYRRGGGFGHEEY